MMLFLIMSTTASFGQKVEKDTVSVDRQSQIQKQHFLSINPVKPFIGLPNVLYEYQICKGLSITAFTEVLAYQVITDFNHPDMVSTFGVSFYPFIGDEVINQGFFININTSYVLYFRGQEKPNSFANGIQLGYKWLFTKKMFIEPKLLLNYVYQERSVLPGFEVMVGFRF